ncbi:MAG TPA: hypothetical protein VGL93_11415 [Streptosporangiaceae bacterium]
MTPGRLPTGGQYQAAVQNPGRCFTDPVLRDAVPQRTALGLPKPISGNFASVFPMTAPSGERYAVKCFTRDVPHQLQRYELISARLHALRPWWGTDFVFQPEGVRVEGVAYPILRMDWIEAVSLTRWVDAVVDAGGADALDGLADRFDAVVAELAAAGIAHGDLQHGNVLVRDDGELRIIDYDGMYFPGLAGLPSDEVGHPNFQPPGRTPADYGPAMDRFSARLISLSLRAIAADPPLWDRFNPDHEEYLLLDQSDFADPLASKHLAEILAHDDARVRGLGTFVRDCLPLPLEAMPDPTARTAAPPKAAAAAPAPADAGPASAAAPASTLPAWLSGRIAARPATGGAEEAAGVGAGADAGPVAEGGGAARGSAMVWALRVLVALAVAGLVAAGAGIGTGAAGVALGGVAGLAVCGGVAYVLYRRGVSGTAGGGARVGGLERRRDELDARVKEIGAAYEVRRREARAAFDAEVAGRVRRRDELAAELAGIEGERRDEGFRLLAARQAAHVAERLASVVLAPREVDGLSTLDIVHLKAAGITRPSDFSGIVYRAGHRSAPGARPLQVPYIQRPDGTEIKVTGIGEAKARRLEWWRNRHVTLARRDQPTRLPPGDEADLDARYAPRLASVREALTRARSHADAHGPREDLTRALARLDAEQRDAQRPVTEERTRVGQALQAARATADG